MRIVIAVVAGPHQGQTFSFEEHSTFLVGRSPQAHFRLPQKDEYFSRLHFLVEVCPPHCRLMDLGSTNGTLVNGTKVKTADLKDGDIIEGGQTRMRVSVLEDVEAATRVREPVATPAPTAESLATMPPLAAPPPRPATAPPGGETDTDLPALPFGPAVETCRVCSAPAPASPVWPLCATCYRLITAQPQPFPAYWLVRELGKGGMGVVHLAARRHDGRASAVKTIRPAVAAGHVETQRFLREVELLSRLNHPNIVRLQDSGESAGMLYFAMDLIAGVNGAQLVQHDGRLLPARAANITVQLLEALHHAHEQGVVHRDVKPANLMVTGQDSRDVVRVLDFGLARAYQLSKLSGLTMAGSVGGTAPYMAPEQVTDFRGAKPSVDQYAAAATLYYFLTARHAHDFPSDPQSCLVMLLTDPIVPVLRRQPGVPPGLAQVIEKALSREPAARYPSCAAFADALRPFAAPR